MSWWLDIFRRTWLGYFADFAITPPVTAYLLGLSFEATAQWLSMFLLSLVAWSAYEYGTHRWVSHGVPFLREAHWLHHENQLDYIAVPPWATVAFYAFFWWAFGLASTPLSVGFSVGYCAYSYLHTAFHYQRIGRGHVLFGLKYAHVVHHRTHDRNYGVSSPLWDVALGTYQRS